jgi:hypothetical protein
MTTIAKPDKKSIVAELDFDTRTAKRVAWSEWEFTIVAPFEIEVCNASYGCLKDEHTYRVMIDQDGVPVSCSCPGFTHFHGPKGKVGKHMLAVAAIGGPTLLDAARAFSAVRDTSDSEDRPEVTPDGGLPEDDSDSCENGDPKCDGPGGDGLPCFCCFNLKR